MVGTRRHASAKKGTSRGERVRGLGVVVFAASDGPVRKRTVGPRTASRIGFNQFDRLNVCISVLLDSEFDAALPS